MLSPPTANPQRVRALIGCIAIVVTSAFSLQAPAIAQQATERPLTEDLLPETTVVYFQVDNVQESIPKLIGNELLEDENISPFLNRMYEEAETAYDQIEDEVGLSIQQIQELPTGEMTVAVIAPRRKDLEFLIAIDIDPESESAELAAESLLQRVEENLLANEDPSIGSETIESETTAEGIEIGSAQVTLPEFGDRVLNWFTRDGFFVGCTSKSELLAVLERWEGREVAKVRPLSQNRKFITIMNRCRDTADVQPEFRFFIDPLSLARSGFRGNTAVLTAMNFLPSVGLDGVLGFGASADLHNEQFKVVMHSHLLLANPKSGVLEVLALKPGESEPQPFVPNNIINYSNTHWDPPKAFVEVQKMIDTFMGEGHFESEFIGQFRDTFELDLETDVINQLSGRITHLQWSQPDSPYLMNNTCQALAIGVKDSEEAQKVLETIMEYARARMRKRDENAEPWPKSDHQGVSVWTMASAEDMEKRWQERREKRGREGTNDSFRMPYPTYSILDDHVIVSDSVEMMHHLIDVSQGDADMLADNDQYHERMDTLLNAADSDMPCAVMWSNPEPVMRDLIRLLTDERSKDWADEQAERLPWLASLLTAVEEEPVPDYEQFKKYFPPAGVIVTTDDTGYHFLTFQYSVNDDE